MNKFKLYLLLPLLFLNACAYNSVGTPEYQRVHVEVIWVRSAAMCPFLTGEPKAIACATYSPAGPCTMRAEPDAPDWVLGHEVRHCFTGSFHKTLTKKGDSK